MNWPKKTLWWGIIILVILRFALAFLLMRNIPFTDMQSGGFRPNFGGSYFPDEIHYFELAQSFAKLSPIPNVANIGYPLFLAPIVYFTGATNPEGIAKIVFLIQAFLFFSSAIVLIAFLSYKIFSFQDKSMQSRSVSGRKSVILSLIAASIFTFYPYILMVILRLAGFPRWIPAFHYQMWITISADYLSAVLLYSGFYLFIKKFNYGEVNTFSAATVGALVSAAALVRVANILYLPLIFFIFIFIKKYRESVFFGVTAFSVYLPQWIYNFYFFGSPFTYGYRIQELSGHGLEMKIVGGWLSFNNIAIFFEKIWLNLPMIIWILPILAIILVAGFWQIFKSEKNMAFVLLFWALINIIFYLFFVDAQSQLRYFIPSIPPLIILMLAGIMKINELRRLL